MYTFYIFGLIVRDSLPPHAVDNLQPLIGELSQRLGVAVALGSPMVIERLGPRAVLFAAACELVHGIAPGLFAGTTNGHVSFLAALLHDGCNTTEKSQWVGCCISASLCSENRKEPGGKFLARAGKGIEYGVVFDPGAPLGADADAVCAQKLIEAFVGCLGKFFRRRKNLQPLQSRWALPVAEKLLRRCKIKLKCALKAKKIVLRNLQRGSGTCS